MLGARGAEGQVGAGMAAPLGVRGLWGLSQLGGGVPHPPRAAGRSASGDSMRCGMSGPLAATCGVWGA